MTGPGDGEETTTRSSLARPTQPPASDDRERIVVADALSGQDAPTVAVVQQTWLTAL